MNRAWWQRLEGLSFRGSNESYRLDKLLGVGGFGAVFRATPEASPEEPVALKLILPDDQGPEEPLRELVRGLTLRHDCLVQGLDAGLATLGDIRYPYLAMELAEGTLQDRLLLPRFRLSPADALRLVGNVASALQYLHARRPPLVHRDLKPGNLLWVRNGWKLADYGIARPMSGTSSAFTGRVIGTFDYMPPESFEGVVSPAWDVWALGVLLVEAVAGRRPFAGSNDLELLTAIRERPPAGVEGIPELLRRVALGCLTKSREERWTVKRILDVLGAEAARGEAEALAGRGDAAAALAKLQQAATLDPERSELAARGAALRADVEQHDRRRREAALRERIQAEIAARRWLPALACLREALTLAPGDEQLLGWQRQAERELVDAQLREHAPVEDVATQRSSNGKGDAPAPAGAEVPASGQASSPPVFSDHLPPQGAAGGQADKAVGAGSVQGKRIGTAVVACLGVGLAIYALSGGGRTPEPEPAPVKPAAEDSALAGSESRTLKPEPTATVPAIPYGQGQAESTSGAWTDAGGLRYVLIPAGTFWMGCSEGDGKCASDETPRHAVTITKPYWMGQTEVTVAAYQRFAQATGRAMPPEPSFNAGWRDGQQPVVNVDWSDAGAYCAWAGGRLPTEAEWEHAARGGTTGARDGALDTIAWSGIQAQRVGQKGANAYGLHDMLGNVWEWVSDWYGPYGNAAVRDPTGPASGPGRVWRDGSWGINPWISLMPVRGSVAPAVRNFHLGVRCAREQ